MTTRLIIVRAGDESLHSSWGAGNWDLLNAYYDDNPPADALAIKGGKWDGIWQVFQERAELLTKYKTIWLPDDDIATDAATIEKMFALHERYNLQLSQPALSYDSFVLHSALLQNPKFILRYSDFVEIMMPCFDSQLLARVLPLFENNITGTFLDALWHRYSDDPYEAAAVLDEVAMRHSRPVATTQGSLINRSKARADGAWLANKTNAVSKRLLAEKLPRLVFYGGVLKNNKKIVGVRKTGWLVFLGFISKLLVISREAHIGFGFSKRGAPFMFSRFFRHILLRHLYRTPNLKKLCPID